jgi:hypothetical protein
VAHAPETVVQPDHRELRDETVPLAELLKQSKPAKKAPVPEIGGRTDGPEPTRYGDWEKNGRCIDF